MSAEDTATPGPRALLDGFAHCLALVVGGAGGIGAAVTTRMADLGARVVVASRSAPWSDDLALPASGRVVAQRLDITDPASILNFAAWITARSPGLDILVNSAGVTRSVPMRDLGALDDETIDLVLDSNASGPLRLIRALAPNLRRGRDPVIVNVSSVAARTGIGSNIAYVGAKAALDAMSVALAKALAPEIRVVNVAPSALETDFVKGRTRDFLDRTIALTPLGRLATPGEVANAILCAARLLTMTTGTTIFVDGGRHL